MAIHTSHNGAPAQVSKLYTGVNGVPKRVCQVFLGVDGVPKLVYDGGKGTEESPFIIWNESDLRGIIQNPSAHYALGKTITISDVWRTITVPFTGVLDGRGYGIRIMHGSTTGEFYGADTLEGYGFGLFGINDGHIKNLSITIDYLGTSYKVNQTGYGGCIAAYNKGIIEQCAVVQSGGIYGRNEIMIGGLVGKNCASGIIRDCKVNIALFYTSSGSAGGICYLNEGDIQRTVCYAYSTYITTVGFTTFGYLCHTQNGVFKDSTAIWEYRDPLTSYSREFETGTHPFGSSYTNGVQSMTTNGMKIQSNYNNFNFVSVWIMGSLGPNLRFTA